jgi:hypothetical protein
LWEIVNQVFYKPHFTLSFQVLSGLKAIHKDLAKGTKIGGSSIVHPSGA